MKLVRINPGVTRTGPPEIDRIWRLPNVKYIRHFLLIAVAVAAVPTGSMGQAPPTSEADSTSAEIVQKDTNADATSIVTVGPGTISFQGYAEQTGVPYTGSLAVNFRIFDVASGGAHLWEEAQVVDANAGVFNVELGSVTPLSLPFDEPYWLAIKLGADAYMTDRIKLLESPYAFTSAALQGRPVSTSAPAAGNLLGWNGSAWAPTPPTGGSGPWSVNATSIYYNSGDVGIGTTAPNGKFEINANSSLSDPQIMLHEDGNDYARINFDNNNGSNYWTIAAYIASNHRNDRLNFWNGVGGDVMTITGDGEVGIGVGISPKVDFHVGNGKAVLFGIDTLGNGDKLMFIPRLHAFRVGSIATGAASTYWNPDSIGLYSFASGFNTRAQGFGATAMGRDTEATNSYAFASGFFSNADGQYSTAMGFNTDALALGSTALGYSTDAEENYTFAAGYFAEAQAIYSIALGNTVQAQSYSSTAIGRYNVGGGSATAWNANDPLFEIGNGSSTSARSNAITVQKDGDVGIGTTFPTATLHVIGTTRLGTAEEITDGGSYLLDFDATLRPAVDNGRSLGNSAKRWSSVWSVDGSINTSDARLKEGVQSLDSALGKVMGLRPVSFRWNSGPDRGNRYGLVAQEVMNVLPEAVVNTEFVQDEETGIVTEVPTQYMGINYDRVIPFLIKAMQEQQEMIVALQAEVEALKR